MPTFRMPDNTFQDGATYAAARTVYNARVAVVAPPPAPVVVAPVVVTVTPVLTPAANFAGRSTIRFGIGEVINLSFTTTPLGRSAASLGGLTWVATSGGQLGTLVNDGVNSGTGSFTCGLNAGAVTLALKTAGMAPQTKATKQILIVQPSDAVMVRAGATGTFHRLNSPSAGFRGAIHLRPADVSFSNTELREGAAAYEGTGIFARGEVSQVELGTSYNTIHPVLGSWVRVNGGDSSVNGSMVNGIDTVSTQTGVIGAGTFTWNIPWFVRVLGGAGGEIRVKTAVHSVVVDGAGNMTISKAGTSVTHNLGDANSDY